MKTEKDEKPKESEKKGEGKKGGKKAAKKHLHQVITTRAHDGSWMHEHVYKKKPEDAYTEPPVFAGTSQDMDDLHQHVDDHWGAGHEEPDGDEGQGEGEPETGQPAERPAEAE